MRNTTPFPATARILCPLRSRATAFTNMRPAKPHPHSALGLGALGGLLAAKAAMEKHGLPGKLVFFGEPAEKVCGSKPVHAAHGYYDDLDATVAFHPAFSTAHANTVIWDTHCGSYWSRMYSFECPHPEQWSGMGAGEGASAHTMARAPGAIDAVCLMYMTSKMTKELMLPHTGTWTINEAILAAGQATADNLAPNFSQIQYSSRCPTLEMQERIYAVLDNNADNVARITHCIVRKEWVTKTRPGLPNHAIAALAYGNLALGGTPRWGDDARRFGREVQKNLGLEPMEDPIHPAMTALTTPEEDEGRLRAILPPWQKNYTSDDYTEYTWHCPTAHVYVGRAMLASPQPGYQYPAWVWNALGRFPRDDRPNRAGRRSRHRRQPGRSHDRSAGPRGGAGRISRAHRRGPWRQDVGRASSAEGFPGADPLPLARICQHAARRGMVAAAGRLTCHSLEESRRCAVGSRDYTPMALIRRP